MKPGDWIGYELATTDARVRKLAALRLGVPEKHIEIRRTGGAVLARVRREGQDD